MTTAGGGNQIAVERGEIDGVVRGTTRDGMPNPTMPAEEPGTPPPLAGARVVLRGYAGDESPAGAIVASATTAADGRFHLVAPAGKYFLCVVGSSEPHALLTTGKAGKNFTESDAVNSFVIVTIEASRVVTQDLSVPQAWPV